MTDLPVIDDLMKKFLLGQLDDKDRRWIEESFVCDGDIRERILIVEEELIEEYLEGVLTEHDQHCFRTHYLSSPQQYRKLRVAKSLKQAIVAEVGDNSRSKDAEGSSWWEKLVRVFAVKRKRPWVPIAATVTVIIVAGSIWLVWLQRVNWQEQKRRDSVQQQLKEANTPQSIRTTPSPEILSVVLAPVSVRGIARPVHAPSGTRVVELWLVDTTEREYAQYQAQFNKLGSSDRFVIDSLHRERTAAGNAIRLRVPLGLLAPGDYQVSLSGVNRDGKPELLGEYTLNFGG